MNFGPKVGKPQKVGKIGPYGPELICNFGT